MDETISTALLELFSIIPNNFVLEIDCPSECLSKSMLFKTLVKMLLRSCAIALILDLEGSFLPYHLHLQV